MIPDTPFMLLYMAVLFGVSGIVMMADKGRYVAVVLIANWIITRAAYVYGGDHTLELTALSDLLSIILLAVIRTTQAGSIACLFVVMMISYWLAINEQIPRALMWSIAELLGYAQIFIMVFYGMVDGRGFHIGSNRHRYSGDTLDL